jgi:hypothetical protein
MVAINPLSVSSAATKYVPASPARCVFDDAFSFMSLFLASQKHLATFLSAAISQLRSWLISSRRLATFIGEDLAEEVRKYHIPDFSNWKNHDAFERAFARLEKDLRTSIGK